MRTNRKAFTRVQLPPPKSRKTFFMCLSHKSTVILIELRWTFSMPENRLKSRLLPFLSINEPRRRAILQRGFVLYMGFVAFLSL